MKILDIYTAPLEELHHLRHFGGIDWFVSFAGDLNERDGIHHNGCESCLGQLDHSGDGGRIWVIFEQSCNHTSVEIPAPRLMDHCALSPPAPSGSLKIPMISRSVGRSLS